MLCLPIKKEIVQNFRLHPRGLLAVNWRKPEFFGGQFGFVVFFCGGGGGNTLTLSHPFLLVCSRFSVEVFFVLSSFGFCVMSIIYSASLFSPEIAFLSLCVSFLLSFLASFCSVFFFCFLVLGFVLLASFLSFSLFLPRFFAFPFDMSLGVCFFCFPSLFPCVS